MQGLIKMSERVAAGRSGLPGRGTPRAVQLSALAPTGSNPGDLKAWCHVPDRARPMPLVVVLHGCTQTAAGYDAGSGWSALAERHGFAVLFPEQQRANNPNMCFNWFSAPDVQRGSGEVLSIREMVATMIERHGIDPARVFVTGLSAGGAMASALLASYPDVFAGGAIIAGLPAGAASSIPQAFQRMRGQGHADASSSATYVRDASTYRGEWPTVAVWHGGADATVSPLNADAILAQWQALHGVSASPDKESRIDGATFRQWRDSSGRVCVEDYRIAGMGHGTPIATSGDTACGTAAAFMLDVGISSTWHSAARWGLLDLGALASADNELDDVAAAQGAGVPPANRVPAFGIQATIEAALRSAGLMP